MKLIVLLFLLSTKAFSESSLKISSTHRYNETERTYKPNFGLNLNIPLFKGISLNNWSGYGMILEEGKSKKTWVKNEFKFEQQVGKFVYFFSIAHDYKTPENKNTQEYGLSLSYKIW